MSPIRSISAVTLVVSDMCRSVGFYQALGFDIAMGGEEASFTTLLAGQQFLNLSKENAHIQGSWGRVIFHVDDVDRVYERACSRGMKPEFSPRDAPWGERYFHILDPDRHEISFARPLAEIRPSSC